MKSGCCGKPMRILYSPERSSQLGYQEWRCMGRCGQIYRQRLRKSGKVSARHFCSTISANVNNSKLSNADFREFIRNTLPIVDF